MTLINYVCGFDFTLLNFCFEFVKVEKLKEEKELNSIIVYGQESSKQIELAEEDNNSVKDECKVHCCLYFTIQSSIRLNFGTDP